MGIDGVEMRFRQKETDKNSRRRKKNDDNKWKKKNTLVVHEREGNKIIWVAGTLSTVT